MKRQAHPRDVIDDEMGVSGAVSDINAATRHRSGSIRAGAPIPLSPGQRGLIVCMEAVRLAMSEDGAIKYMRNVMAGKQTSELMRDETSPVCCLSGSMTASTRTGHRRGG